MDLEQDLTKDTVEMLRLRELFEHDGPKVYLAVPIVNVENTSTHKLYIGNVLCRLLSDPEVKIHCDPVKMELWITAWCSDDKDAMLDTKPGINTVEMYKILDEVGVYNEDPIRIRLVINGKKSSASMNLQLLSADTIDDILLNGLFIGFRIERGVEF